MKRAALWVLSSYKRWISPSLPPSCRYVPTCSEYAMEAVEHFGVARGGYDPVIKDVARCGCKTDDPGSMKLAGTR